MSFWLGRGRLPLWPGLLALGTLLGLWELYVDLGGVDPLVLPAPHAVASALWTDRGQLWHGFLITGQEIVFGIAVAAPVALAVALLVHVFPLARRAIFPLLWASQAIPIPILAPALILWFGFGLLPKLAVIGLVAFFPLTVTTLAGLEAVDPELPKLLRTFDATRWQILRRLELPAALPGMFTGAKLASVFSVIGAVLGEQAGSSSGGLGYLLIVTVQNLEMAEAYAAVVLLAAFAIGLAGLLTVLERRLLPWAYHPRG